MKINKQKINNFIFSLGKIIVIIFILSILFSFFLTLNKKGNIKKDSIEYFYQDVESLNLTNSFDEERFFTLQEIIKDLENKDYVIYEVKDVIINNPQGKPNYTITVIINNEVRFLYVGANGYPTMGLAYLKLKDSNGLNYIDDSDQEEYFQYIKIYKNQDELYSYDFQEYLEFPCQLYIKDLIPGENPNGKFAPIKAGKIGQ